MVTACTPGSAVLTCGEQAQARLGDITEKLQDVEDAETEISDSFDISTEDSGVIFPAQQDPPIPGFNSKLNKELREGLVLVGIFPPGPPSEPKWMEFVSPEDACPISTPESWRCVDFHALSVDPFFASIVGPWIQEFPCLRDLKLPLPNSPSPQISFFPGLLSLPNEILLYQTRTHIQTDCRLNAPELVESPCDHPLITWYRQVWNLHCAARQYWLAWQGYQSDWNWASGFFPRASEETLKETFAGNSLMDENGSKIIVRYGQLLKGFAKMPRAMATLGIGYHPKPAPRRLKNGTVDSSDEAHYS
ncbi:hypothetical protein EV426DRAFT_575974 [Tirmania nivea]|nr:hypothetical protein EV426DRAFT_575974 [Tirmania nivea]